MRSCVRIFSSVIFSGMFSVHDKFSVQIFYAADLFNLQLVADLICSDTLYQMRGGNFSQGGYGGQQGRYGGGPGGHGQQWQGQQQGGGDGWRGRGMQGNVMQQQVYTLSLIYAIYLNICTLLCYAVSAAVCRREAGVRYYMYVLYYAHVSGILCICIACVCLF
jgi:hypothetical protein